MRHILTLAILAMSACASAQTFDYGTYSDGTNTIQYRVAQTNDGHATHFAWHLLRAEVLNRDFLKDTEGTRQNYPLRTFASGVYLNGYSDHFPTEIFVTRRIPAPKR